MRPASCIRSSHDTCLPQLLTLPHHLALQVNDAQRCARVLGYLSKLYNITDKSGVGTQGHFSAAHAGPVALDDVKPGDVDSQGMPIDVELYRRFWGLQARARPAIWSNRTRVDTSVCALLCRENVPPCPCCCTSAASDDCWALFPTWHGMACNAGSAL